MVEVSLVNSSESIGSTTVVLGPEGDGGVATRTEVKSCAAHLAELLDGIGSVALILCKKFVSSKYSYWTVVWASRTLGLAVSDGEVARTRVGSVGASVVLDRAAPLESSTGVHEGVAVDGEGPVARRALNSWRSTAEGAGELLDVGSSGGTLVSLGNSSLDIGSSNIRNQEVLRDDAANSVGGDIACVSGASVVIFLGTPC